MRPLAHNAREKPLSDFRKFERNMWVEVDWIIET
jgi:hypothetical protein